MVKLRIESDRPKSRGPSRGNAVRWVAVAGVCAAALALAVPLASESASAQGRDDDRPRLSSDGRTYDDRRDDRFETSEPFTGSARGRNEDPGLTDFFYRTGCFVRNIFVTSDVCRQGALPPLPPTQVTEARGLEDVHIRAAGWEGDAQYQYILGYMFEQGELVEENQAGALLWYTLAAAQGHMGAMEARRRLLEDAYLDEPRDDRGYRSDRDGRGGGGFLYRDEIIDAESQVKEIYKYGGKNAHYRMAEIFLDPERHLGSRGIVLRRNYVEAYAWACLAEHRNHRAATDLRSDLEGGTPGNAPYLEPHELTIAKAICENYIREVYSGEKLFEIGPADMELALSEGPEFQERRADAPSSDDQARAYLNAGRAELARGNIKKARINFQRAIVADQTSQAGMEAQQQLTALTTTCSVPAHYTGVEGHPLATVHAEIPLKMRQRGLKALGLYQGAIDGRPGPNTRRAIEEFQELLNVDETGDLSPRQTVELMCKSAQIHRDPVLMNMLGYMYIHGIGFEIDYKAGLHWFREAAKQNNASSLFNLGVMYRDGLGVTAQPAMAGQYFYEAQKFGHPKARDARRALCRQGGC